MSFQKRRIPKHLILHNSPEENSHFNNHIGIGWVVLAVLLVLASIFVSIQAHATVSDDSNNTYSADFSFKNNNGSKRASLHLSSDAKININGMLARITLTQTFRNDTDEFQEGVYVLPLSETAAVNSMTMQIGERLIIGKIKEKQEAKKIYQEAIRSGKKAALTEQHRPNVFTQKIANIAPQETIKISITYIERVTYKHGTFSWRLPTTLTPRYFPMLPTKKTNTVEGLPYSNYNERDNINDIFNTEGFLFGNDFGTENFIDSSPGNMIDHTQNTIGIDITLNSGFSLSHIDALYHDLSVNKQSGIHKISLAKKRDLMNRDFVLQWSPTQNSTPTIAAYSEEINGEHYTSVLLLPPNKSSLGKNDPNSTDKHTLNSDRIFIIDTSGSMAGKSIDQAKQSLKSAIKNLSISTRFNIIEFNSQFSTLYNNVQDASEQNKHEALQWIDKLQANGGTEMFNALKEAIQQFNDHSNESLQQIIFITDGSVGNEHQLFKLIYEELGGTRLFTVGIGSAPNSFFMRKAAQFGRGSFTHIANLNEVKQKMSLLLTQINTVASKNIHLKLPQLASKDYEQFPKSINDLYFGEPLLASIKTHTALTELTVSGEAVSGPWQKTIQLNSLSNNAKGIGSLWARDKIEALEDEKITQARDLQLIKNDIIDVAIKHKLISQHTSFVAVEQETSRPKEMDITKTQVANLLPHGQVRTLTFPNTATTAEISWWLGLFSVMMLIVFRRLKDDEK